MWHLFDRYKGVVWPKARQMNLIAKILNNLCAGTGIKLDTPTVPSPASPVTIAVDTEWLDDYIGDGGGGGGGGMFAYDPDTGVIKGGYVLAARKWYSVSGITITAGYTGAVVITVTHSGSTISCAMSATSATWTNTATKTYFPLYQFSGGEIVNDWRGAPCVQLYES